MKSFRTAYRLIVTTMLLTAALVTFVFANQDKFTEPEMLGCAVVYANDVIFPAYYNDPLDHKGRAVFEANCKICHRLDQKVVGPALRFSFQRSNNATWYRQWIKNAPELIRSGDALAVALYKEYDEIQHPSYEKMTDETLNDLIEYLKLEGERE